MLYEVITEPVRRDIIEPRSLSQDQMPVLLKRHGSRTEIAIPLPLILRQVHALVGQPVAQAAIEAPVAADLHQRLGFQLLSYNFV